MGDLTAHFSSYEFISRDGVEPPNGIDCRLLAMLEAIRCHFGVVSITSGYRSPEYNSAVGGAHNSFHLEGKAADIVVQNATPEEVYAWADQHFPICGLGLYKTFVHIDCRSYRARWKG